MDLSSFAYNPTSSGMYGMRMESEESGGNTPIKARRARTASARVNDDDDDDDEEEQDYQPSDADNGEGSDSSFRVSKVRCSFGYLRCAM